mgnify:CR=1 FL=1|jgi:hypothetical protein
MDISCNMDFIADSFNEQMDRTVMEAKGEVIYEKEILDLVNSVRIGSNKN